MAMTGIAYIPTYLDSWVVTSIIGRMQAVCTNTGNSKYASFGWWFCLLPSRLISVARPIQLLTLCVQLPWLCFLAISTAAFLASSTQCINTIKQVPTSMRAVQVVVDDIQSTLPRLEFESTLLTYLPHPPSSRYSPFTTTAATANPLLYSIHTAQRMREHNDDIHGRKRPRYLSPAV
jgi:hypothetical protein